jgi:hypothetical protein
MAIIRVTTAVVMMTWMAVSGAQLVAQDLRIDPSDVAAIRVSVETLAEHVGQFAGLRVRIHPDWPTRRRWPASHP